MRRLPVVSERLEYLGLPFRCKLRRKVGWLSRGVGGGEGSWSTNVIAIGEEGVGYKEGAAKSEVLYACGEANHTTQLTAPTRSLFPCLCVSVCMCVNDSQTETRSMNGTGKARRELVLLSAPT